MLLGYGGTYSIESPEPYSPQAQALIRDLGIDVSSYSQYFDKKFYPSLGLARHVFFDKETFGADKAVVDPRSIANGEGEDDDIAKSALTRFLGTHRSRKRRRTITFVFSMTRPTTFPASAPLKRSCASRR